MSRLWSALQIMTFPVLIRVLWLTGDEQGDRLTGCSLAFFSLLFPVRYLYENKWPVRSPWCFRPPTPSLLCSEELFSMFLPLRGNNTDSKTLYHKPAVPWFAVVLRMP